MCPLISHHMSKNPIFLFLHGCFDFICVQYFKKAASTNKLHELKSPKPNPLQPGVDYPSCGSLLLRFPAATQCPAELGRVNAACQALVAL